MTIIRKHRALRRVATATRHAYGLPAHPLQAGLNCTLRKTLPPCLRSQIWRCTGHLNVRHNYSASAHLAIRSDASEIGMPLAAAAAHGCFQLAVGLGQGFRAGQLALDARQQILFIASGDHVLVQDMTNRLKAPSRLDFGAASSLKLKLSEGFSATSTSATYHHPLKIKRNVPGLHVWFPEGADGPQFFKPEEVADLESLFRTLPHGAPFMIAGRVFGRTLHIGEVRDGLSVAHNDHDSWLGWPGSLHRCDDAAGTVRLQEWKCISPTAYESFALDQICSRFRTLALSPCLIRTLATLVPIEALQHACHGDVFASIGFKGQPAKSRSIHIPAEFSDGKDNPDKKYADSLEVVSGLGLGEVITGLAYDAPQQKLLVATSGRLLEHCRQTSTTRCLSDDDVLSGCSGGIGWDQSRGLLYFPNGNEVQALCVADGQSRPVASFASKFQNVKSVTPHREWLFVAHAEGVTLIDQVRGVDMLIARSEGALAATVVQDRVAIIFEHAVHLATWSLSDIGARLAHLCAGDQAEVPPPTESWVGLGRSGYPVVGLPPSNTALNGIAGVLCHKGEVFIAHDAGVFSMPLSPPPVHVGPENESKAALETGFADEFVVAVPTHGVLHNAESTVLTAGTLPYSLALAEQQPSNGVLLMSPVIQWREGKKWVVRFPLRKPNASSLIMGLAPEEDCYANAVLLPADARPQRPRVDGILIHRPNAWDESSHAVRLHEIVPAEQGKPLWSVGTDVVKYLKEALGLNEKDPFFLGDVDGGIVLELSGTCQSNSRGGVEYRLEAAKLCGLQPDYPLDVSLIEQPLEAFTMSHSRRVRFYVCTLAPSNVEEESIGESRTTAALDWMPEHLPNIRCTD